LEKGCAPTRYREVVLTLSKNDVQLYLKSLKSFLDRVSTGSGSDLVGD